MKALQTYVDRKNAWGYTLDLTSAQDRQKIANSIDADLSPENLTCDGELSHSEVQARYRHLTQAAADLKRLDPSVRFYEIV